MAVLFKEIDFGFGGLKLIENLNFRLKKGLINCIYGRNGSGKSTIIRLIAGIEKPDKGEILLDDNFLKFGFMLQFPEHLFYHATVYEEILSFTNSEEVADSIFFDERLNKIKNLSPLSVSDGQKRLIFIKSLISVADVLVLDEPFASLDEISKKGIKNDLLECKKNDKTVIYTANRFKDCDIADEVLRL